MKPLSPGPMPRLHWISSARVKVLLMRRTIVGTESYAYSDWSGYMVSLVLPSAATCQPDRYTASRPALACCIAWPAVIAPKALT